MIKKIAGWIKWLLVFAWLLLLILGGAKFAQQNHELVELKVLAWQLPEMSTGILVSFTLAAGVIVGLLAFLPGLLFARLKIRRLQARLNKAQHQVADAHLHNSTVALPKQ